MKFDFNQNHFELFGLPPTFRLDLARLEHAYREIQAQVHPDKFVQASDSERRLSMQWATHANEAFATLKFPVSRARYILQLNGVATLEETNTAMPAEFLLSQMEWREAIAEAKEAQDLPALEHLARKYRAEMDALVQQLAELLDNQKNYPAAAEAVRKLKFLERLGSEINLALEALENS